MRARVCAPECARPSVRAGSGNCAPPPRSSSPRIQPHSHSPHSHVSFLAPRCYSAAGLCGYITLHKVLDVVRSVWVLQAGRSGAPTHTVLSVSEGGLVSAGRNAHAPFQQQVHSSRDASPTALTMSCDHVFPTTTAPVTCIQCAFMSSLPCLGHPGLVVWWYARVEPWSGGRSWSAYRTPYPYPSYPHPWKRRIVSYRIREIRCDTETRICEGLFPADPSPSRPSLPATLSNVIYASRRVE